ncbi:MAG TPA: hypothetical protein VGP36_03945 [Mycobacteriales bacterium]|jgi:hypothetical protein|nr:hypothetical protein [Mycobacteriales bacterium]
MNLSRGRTALAVLSGAAFLLPLTGTAAADPAPQPVFDHSGAAVTTTNFGQLKYFYEAADGTLAQYTQDDPIGQGAGPSLGGALHSRPAAVTVNADDDMYVFATGADDAVWFRKFVRATWGPWTSIGGRSLTAPAVSCAADTQPLVYVVGGDGALWRRSLAGGGWSSLGGRMGSAPAAVPAVSGTCAVEQDLFVRGDNGAVYENRAGTGWTRVGGLTFQAPTVIRLPNGSTEVYVIGTDGALYLASRAPGGVFSSFHRIGGVFTSSPSAQLWRSGTLRVVVGQGADGRVWRGTSRVGSSIWAWTRPF